MLSDRQFYLEPSHASGLETPIIILALMQLTSNQSLVITNLEDFYSSSTTIFDIIIRISHCYQSFTVVVEVNLEDLVFSFADDHFNFGNLFVWVKCVAVLEVTACSSFHRLTIVKSETKGK